MAKNPSTALRKALDPKPINAEGVVESVNGLTVVVRTSRGRREMTAAGSVYKAGDRIKVSGDVIVGRIAPRTSLPTYYV